MSASITDADPLQDILSLVRRVAAEFDARVRVERRLGRVCRLDVSSSEDSFEIELDDDAVPEMRDSLGVWVEVTEHDLRERFSCGVSDPFEYHGER